ncbi:Hypothetical protein NTJ_02877 [Nesidiocoris tenuis]|uniref:Uncharacterized protein n=1 Tax=Nesidiocoris tenuis TaxID=355587 RepID=A0ABN7ACR6_9HEMI|nr:Hypothetical protein NTJ_02877 [Nesidiocoris tenuis]
MNLLQSSNAERPTKLSSNIRRLEMISPPDDDLWLEALRPSTPAGRHMDTPRGNDRLDDLSARGGLLTPNLLLEARGQLSTPHAGSCSGGASKRGSRGEQGESLALPRRPSPTPPGCDQAWLENERTISSSFRRTRVGASQQSTPCWVTVDEASAPLTTPTHFNGPFQGHQWSESINTFLQQTHASARDYVPRVPRSAPASLWAMTDEERPHANYAPVGAQAVRRPLPLHTAAAHPIP